VYSLDSEIDNLRLALNDSIVVLGLSDVQRGNDVFQMKFQTSGYWRKPQIFEGMYWCGKVYVSVKTQRKVCFFEWFPSFMGEPAETMGFILLEHGAQQLIHFACKVGTLTGPTDINMLFAPTQFRVFDDVNEEVKLSNSVRGGFSTGLHISFLNPFDETSDRINELIRRHGAVSVDDEGAYLARSVARFNQEYCTNRQFGAFYYASDYIVRAHEKDWKSQLMEFRLLDDNSILNAPDTNAKRMRNQRLADILCDYILHSSD
jgi:hypothetical protein